MAYTINEKDEVADNSIDAKEIRYTGDRYLEDQNMLKQARQDQQEVSNNEKDYYKPKKPGGYITGRI